MRSGHRIIIVRDLVVDKNLKKSSLTSYHRKIDRKTSRVNRVRPILSRHTTLQKLAHRSIINSFLHLRLLFQETKYSRRSNNFFLWSKPPSFIKMESRWENTVRNIHCLSNESTIREKETIEIILRSRRNVRA